MYINSTSKTIDVIKMKTTEKTVINYFIILID